MSSSRSSSTIGVLELSDPVRRAYVRIYRSTWTEYEEKSRTNQINDQHGAGKYTLINIVDIGDRAGLWPRRDPKLQ
ncbi:hypothetical protein PGT21_036904 [Puccinia graminis f. sp. tritici]|uniref:Uncharacterized protein n=1 Tax=Puccinia graminis f. sp. tritici TaxID=56615 RepID=A0A5B0SNT1_PUCGR|nr:hypothetical protein PGT21_036482 [Puccinia graminis f. sp. tritici]KAA1111144.1 hypothetical protein PGT21_036904 [Puccinia graminis f. sp. tritici]KAA1138803.1 hypothetical protein PGTUg99_012634 [Puccinia graminis f. sp. tritici]